MIAVFPVADNPGARPMFEDGFGAWQGHHGIDIMVPEGTPVLAPKDGQALFIADGVPCTKGPASAASQKGLSYHLQALDGSFFFGTHLLAWNGSEGDTKSVKAGDRLGWVGRSGNACDRPPHLHFEEHQGGVPVDPYAELLAAARWQDTTPAPGTAPPAVPMTPGLITLPLAGKALLAAFSAKHPDVGAADAVYACRFPFAQALTAEGSFSETFRGSNNWGGMQATDGWIAAHKTTAGFGVLAHLDTDPSYGPYIGRFQMHASPFDGAMAFLELVEGKTGPLTAIHRGGDVEDAFEYAKRLYIGGWFVGSGKDRTPLDKRAEAFANGTETADDDRNVSDYVRALMRGIGEAEGALAAAAADPGDPRAVTLGPPFAPLAQRLTPGRPPHTLEHARQLLARSRGPLTIAQCLAKDALEQGAWLFGTGQPVLVPTSVATSSRSPSAAEIMLALAGTVATGIGAVQLARSGRRRHFFRRVRA